MELEGKVALVTGASRGIGAATAKLLAARGAAVVVNYLQSEKAAREVVAAIGAEGGRALAIKADVREREQVDEMAKAAEKAFGPLNVLVINASIGFPVKPFLEYPWDAFEAKLLGEMKAAFNCCKAVVPGMVARKSGSVIAISSGLSRHPGQGFCAHSSAKSALDAFIKSLALELGPSGVRANAVAPGLTLTDATSFLPAEAKEASARATPLKRNGLPEDIAGAVLFLASDASRFVTGQYIPVSGGIMML
ncbi:MAG: SDR family oxidoreductase [Acidobacteria bacterium]|jgi:3-oxoacyl-[acyl-carrier protein] reductase|nr:SDR family oxidoreductase [Acidobacteriota bacterium]